MILLPWFTVTFIKGDAGMAICFILFYLVNPLYSILIGLVAGQSIRSLGTLPLMSSFLFLVGTWLFFSLGELDFILYAGIYFILGNIIMFISRLWNKHKEK